MTSSTEKRPPLPYFDMLLEQLNLGTPAVQEAFGRHVHWGYWENPGQATGTTDDFAIAAERLCQKVYRTVEVQEGQRLLDAGCGFGGTIASLNENFQHLNLTGLNIDPRQLERARQEVQPLHQNKIQFIEGDACQMPLESGTMDVVLAVECIFHFPSREAFFREARRVLQPGGRLGICDFVPMQILRSLEGFLSQFGSDLVARTYGQVDSSTTLAKYQDLAQKTGFKVVTQTDITANTLPTYPVVRDIFGRFGLPDSAQSTAAIELISRLRLLRYQILSFERID
ncbi:MAG: class I SAM-dependent methyltransferase [Prochlorotrichaceae cyanobacterium]